MSDSSIQSDANLLAQAASFSTNAVHEAWDFSSQSLAHLDRRGRQVQVVAHGLIVGGIKDLPNELLDHTQETAIKFGLLTTIAAFLSAAASSKVTLVTSAAKWLGHGLAGAAVIHTAFDLSSKPMLQRSLSAVWHDDDPAAMTNSKRIAERECGPTGFAWALCLPAGLVGAIGARAVKAPAKFSPSPNSANTGMLNCSELHCSAIKGSIKQFLPGATDGQVRLLDEFIIEAKNINNHFSITKISGGTGAIPLHVEYKIPGYMRDPVIEKAADDIGVLATRLSFRPDQKELLVATPDESYYQDDCL